MKNSIDTPVKNKQKASMTTDLPYISYSVIDCVFGEISPGL